MIIREKNLFETMTFSNLNFKNKTILITGGAGFIGSNLAFYFQENYPESKLVVFDCFRSGEFFSNGNLKSFGHYKNLIGFKGDVICGNLNNKSDIQLLSDYSFDYIFHQAAISDTRVYNQELVISTNVNSFYDIIELAKKNQSKLIYASSAATYGDLGSPQTVGKELPQNPYGYSKYVMDQIALKNMQDISIVGLRYFNVYGYNEFYKGRTASMVIQLGHQILNGSSPRLFHDSQKIFRDFIFVDDVIQANIKACSFTSGGIFNVGTGTPRSFQDISDILQNELGTQMPTDYFANPYEGYQMHTQADIDSSKKQLGFNPKISLEEGIKSYVPEIKRLSKESHD